MSPDSTSRISPAIPAVIVDPRTRPGHEVPPGVPAPLREVREEILLVEKRRLDREGHRIALRDLREIGGAGELPGAGDLCQ